VSVRRNLIATPTPFLLEGSLAVAGRGSGSAVGPYSPHKDVDAPARLLVSNLERWFPVRIRILTVTPAGNGYSGFRGVDVEVTLGARSCTALHQPGCRRPSGNLASVVAGSWGFPGLPRVQLLLV
jgi:hypothetical protein